MKKKISTKKEEGIKSSYEYLFEKIMKDKRKDLSQFVLSFREQLIKEEKVSLSRSTSFISIPSTMPKNHGRGEMPLTKLSRSSPREKTPSTKKSFSFPI